MRFSLSAEDCRRLSSVRTGIIFLSASNSMHFGVLQSRFIGIYVRLCSCISLLGVFLIEEPCFIAPILNALLVQPFVHSFRWAAIVFCNYTTLEKTAKLLTASYAQRNLYFTISADVQQAMRKNHSDSLASHNFLESGILFCLPPQWKYFRISLTDSSVTACSPLRIAACLPNTEEAIFKNESPNTSSSTVFLCLICSSNQPIIFSPVHSFVTRFAYNPCMAISSSALVASWSITIVGSCANTLAISSLWRWPPDKSRPPSVSLYE